MITRRVSLEVLVQDWCEGMEDIGALSDYQSSILRSDASTTSSTK